MNAPRENKRRSLIQLEPSEWLEQGRELPPATRGEIEAHAIYGAMLILTAIVLYIYGRGQLWWW